MRSYRFIATAHFDTHLLAKAEDPRYFWKWLDVEFVEGVYVSDWYNNDKIKQQEYIGNKMSVLLGMPRLRQLRIQKGKYNII